MAKSETKELYLAPLSGRRKGRWSKW